MKEATPQLVLYQNINKLPFTIFLDIIDTKNLELLVIAGEASEEVLQETWENIYAAYYDALNSDKENTETTEAKDLAINYNKISRARVLLDAIASIGPNETLINELYDFGYNLPANNTKNIDNIIKLFTANHKRDYINLQITTKLSEEEQQEITVIDVNYYMETIAIIMTSLKCGIDIHTLTLGLYVALIKQYKQHYKSLLKLQNNGGN